MPASSRRALRRWLVGLAIGLVLVGVVMAGAAWWLIESLDLKQVVARVERAAEEVTGRPVTIGSKPQISFTPLLKLVVSDVTLGNMEGGARSEMLKLDRLEIGIALTPLLKGKRPGLNIALIEPDLLLEVNERGVHNWALKLSPEEALEHLQKAIAILEGKISLETARIERAKVRFEDRRDGRKLTVTAQRAVLDLVADDDYEFELEGALDGKPVAVQAGFRVPGAGELVPVRVKASLPGLNVSAEGVVRPAWPTPGTDVKLALEFRDASQLANALGIRPLKLPPGKLGVQLQGTDKGMRGNALRLALGRSSMSGSVEVTRFEPRLQLRATLDAPILDLIELIDAGDMPGSASKMEQGDGRIFPATPLQLAALHAVDLESHLKINRLVLPGPRTVEGLQARVLLANGRLAIDPFSAVLGSGRVSGGLRLNARASGTASISVDFRAKGVELGSLVALAGVPSAGFHKGPTDVAIQLASSGSSARALMAALDGHVRAVVGEGRVPGKAAKWNRGVIGQALDLINPYGGSEEGTPLKCAVVNVPVRRGVVAIKDTVAAETDKLAASVTGSADLGQERFDLILNSQTVKGIAPGLADFASAVRVTGTFARPELAVNAKGAAAAGLRLGAAIATAGVTLLAESAVRRAVPAHPCQAALAAKSDAQPAAADDGGKKPGFLERLRGK